MNKSNSGFTLIELIITLAIFAMIVPIAYSLLFVGNSMFNVSAGKGLAQQNVRLLAEYMKEELQYASHISETPDDFHTKYYSIEYDSASDKIIKKHYVFDDSTSTTDVSVVQTITGSWDVITLSNFIDGKIEVNIGHEEKIGNDSSRFDLPFTIRLHNAISEVTLIDVNLIDIEGGVPTKLYYMLPADHLDDVSIGITDLVSDGSEEGIGNRTVSFHMNEGMGDVPAITQSVNADITLPNGSGISRTGYTLKGWNTKADGTGSTYNLGSTIKMPSVNTTLYAFWTSDTVKINDVSLGGIFKINDKYPTQDSDKNYIVKKKAAFTFMIEAIGYTEDHITEGSQSKLVTLTATVDGHKASVNTIEVIEEDTKFYFKFTCMSATGNGSSFKITIESTTSGHGKKQNEYDFISN